MRRYNLGNALKLEDVPTKENRDRVPIDVTEGRVFQRMYLSLAAFKGGFLIGCRLVIRLTGCFLDGAYGGQPLSTIGRDVNDNMNYGSGFWTILADDLCGGAGKRWTFVSDRQKV